MANGGKQNHTADDVKMTSKMTDERIIKALKHCYEHKSCNDCVGCLGAEECILNVDPAGDIYPIINRQQADIERLKAKDERRKKLNYDEGIKQLKAEAIKEFADRLKGTVDLDTFGKLDYAISIHDVDNLVKEMVGEGK
jgi:hypothetical protein